MNVSFLKKILFLGWVISVSPLIRAELTIDITESAGDGIPVAVVPFASSGAPLDISSVVNSDLARSGYFRMLPPQNMPSRPASASAVNFPEWQAINQNYLVVGQVNGGAGGQYNVQFQLLDVLKTGQLLGYQMNSTAADLRRTAHYIADLIFEKITGKKGAFSGRIAYVTSNGKGQYNLQIADTDAYNPQTVTTSVEPLMSPSWSPDKSKIAYVSF
jgi:TolB protein